MPSRQLDTHGRLLLAAIKDLSFRRSLGEIMEVVRGVARDLTGADGVTFVMREDDHCYYADESAIAPLWKGKRFPISMCVSGWVMLNRQAVAIEDIYDDPRVPADAYRATFVQSLAMVPVRAADPVGAIGAYWASRHLATDAEMETLQTLADAAALALANVDLYTALTQSLTREREARDLAERSNEAKDRVLAILSHELRTPLTSILGWARLLTSRSLDPEAQRRGLDAIARNASLQQVLVEDLLDLSVIVSGRLELDLRAVPASEIAAMVREQLGTQIAEGRMTVRCDVDPGATVRADPGRLRQLLAKILANAVKFTPPDGRITVAVERAGDGVEIRVADTGAGIAAEFLPRVFEAFRQADDSASRRHDGLGLGLALVQHLVRLHGGTVDVTSDGPGHGTLVIVRLLAASSDPPDVEAAR
jgi:two-component system CheB/CheR fusion protein